uniref:Cytochrome b-c1 complex subunit 10 n=1 Tax=Cyprinus carpio TaxID=7962 RepID=A0A8C2PUH0_CYPCA
MTETLGHIKVMKKNAKCDPSAVNLCSCRAPTLTVWGGVGGVALVYFTDWRLIMDYVPYINGKFKKDD